MFVRAKIQLVENIEDLDLWAINLIETNSLSQILENSWWWCTWPDHFIELFFDISSDAENAETYRKEISELISIEEEGIKSKSIFITKDAKSNT